MLNVCSLVYLLFTNYLDCVMLLIFDNADWIREFRNKWPLEVLTWSQFSTFYITTLISYDKDYNYQYHNQDNNQTKYQ